MEVQGWRGNVRTQTYQRLQADDRWGNPSGGNWWVALHFIRGNREYTPRTRSSRALETRAVWLEVVRVGWWVLLLYSRKIDGLIVWYAVVYPVSSCVVAVAMLVLVVPH